MDMTSVDPSILYCMFKGEPGTRKSTSALSFPTPQYWFSWDRKMKGLQIPMRNWGIDPKLIKFDDYDDWNKAEAKLKQFQVECPFKTIIIDSITSMADTTLNQTMKMKKGVKRQSGQEAGRKVGGIAVNELEDYNAESAAISDLVRLTKDINSFHRVNVILIAHVIQVEKQSEGGQTHMSRSIVTAGKRIAAKIPAYCDEVYHFNITKGFQADGSGGKYGLLTEHTGDDFARTALPLKGEIEFNNDSLYDKYILPAINKLKQSPEDLPTKF
jgi:AAA domain